MKSETPVLRSRRTEFRFRDLIDSQNHTDAGPGSAEHTGELLVFNGYSVRDDQIQELEIEENVFRLVVDGESGNTAQVMFAVIGPIQPVRDAIHYGLSRRVARSQWSRLEKNSMTPTGREQECPWCQAMIFAVDPDREASQLWCRWCDALVTLDPPEGLGDSERELRLCPQCHLYSDPKKFSEFYFHFEIVIGGVYQKEHTCCRACMRPRTSRMIAGNLIGVLGLPFAIRHWFKVNRDIHRDSPFRGLDRANRAIQKRRFDKALSLYWEIIERHPSSAGVLYNVAMGLLLKGDGEHARQTLEMALSNCPNYPPARRLLDQVRRIDQQV